MCVCVCVCVCLKYNIIENRLGNPNSNPGRCFVSHTLGKVSV